MNVAIFTDCDVEQASGVTTTLRAALQYAPPDLNLRVYSATAPGFDEADYPALPLLGMPVPFCADTWMYWPRFGKFLKGARRDGIDVIHLTAPGPIGLAALYVASRLAVPIVGSCHAGLTAHTAAHGRSPRLGRLIGRCMCWPYRKCGRLLVPSHYTRTRLEPDMDELKIEVWPPGVDTALFTPERRSWRLRDAWHVSEKRPAILYVGRISREKGLAVLPDLHRRLHARGLEHRLILTGAGPMAAELRTQLPDALFTGVQSRRELAEIFASADLFLFPSGTDTAGNVVLEAQASGLPVVVSAEGPARENMLAGRTGVVCESLQPDGWAEAVTGVLRHHGRRAGMTAAAREYALSRQWEPALQALYQTYRELHATNVVELHACGSQLEPSKRPLLQHQSRRQI